jgi:hypothetical protein
MLYSILSQINKGLRRIPILRKSGIPISRRCFDFQICQAFECCAGNPEDDDLHLSVLPLSSSASGDPDYSLAEHSNRGFFRWEGIIPTLSGKKPAGSPL